MASALSYVRGVQLTRQPTLVHAGTFSKCFDAYVADLKVCQQLLVFCFASDSAAGIVGPAATAAGVRKNEPFVHVKQPCYALELGLGQPNFVRLARLIAGNSWLSAFAAGQVVGLTTNLLQIDPLNCGGCHKVCAQGISCCYGQCQDCPGGELPNVLTS